MVLDGNETDIFTLSGAALYAICRRVWALRGSNWGSRPPFLESLVGDLSYGLTIYPMFLLSMVAFSSTALTSLTASNKVLMSLAGFISLVVILKRTFERSSNGSPLSRY